MTDVWGRTSSITPPATQDNSTPPVTFTYDPLGNMRTATRGSATVTLAYDNASRKKTINDPDLGFWQYDYDAIGNMTSQIDARNCATTIIYDPLNRPTNKNYSSCPATGNVAYNYDTGTYGVGRRVSMSVSGGDFTSWTYDIRGRIVSENKQIPGAGQFITYFTYNNADLPKTMTYPVDNEVVTIDYNNDMLPVSVTGNDTYAQVIAYDSAKRMTELVRGVDVLDTVLDYNDWNVDGGRLYNLTTTRPSDSAILQNATYDYDEVGNIWTITDSVIPSDPQTQTFLYDELDRLTNSTVSGGTDGLYTEGYTYQNTTGNLGSKNGATYNYDATHKHAVASVGSDTYGYDANGNMTSRFVDGESFTLNYDAENRLVSVSGAATANFYYDAVGKQVKTIVDGVTTYYIGNHYEVKDGSVTKYYFAGATRLAVRHGTTLNYLLSDHLGSSSVTTNENGIKTASAMYKAFGETRYFFGDLKTDYKFTGQREEQSLGIYFFQARWYDGALGRFISPDSVVPTGNQGTQAWDRYAFVNNNPVRYNDPTGHTMSQGDGGGPNTCTDPTYCENGKPKTYCTDPNAKNRGQEGSCTYPDSPNSGGESSHYYTLTNVVCPASWHCTQAQMIYYLSLFAYPGQDPLNGPALPNTNYSVSPPFGWFPEGSDAYNLGLIQVVSSNGGLTSTNITQPSHIFCCGKVERTLTQNATGAWSVTTVGTGSNSNGLIADINQGAGPQLFQDLDTFMLIYIMDQMFPDDAPLPPP